MDNYTDIINKVKQLQAQAVKDAEAFGKIRNDFNAKHTASQEAEELTLEIVDEVIWDIINNLSVLEQATILWYDNWQQDGLWRIYGIEGTNKVFNYEGFTITDYDTDTEANTELQDYMLDYLYNAIHSNAESGDIDDILNSINDLKEWIADIKPQTMTQSQVDEELEN